MELLLRYKIAENMASACSLDWTALELDPYFVEFPSSRRADVDVALRPDKTCATLDRFSLSRPRSPHFTPTFHATLNVEINREEGERKIKILGQIVTKSTDVN